MHGLDADIKQRVIEAVKPTLKNREDFLHTYLKYRGLGRSELDEEMVAVLATNEAKTPQFWRRLRDKLGDGDFANLADAIIAAIDRLLADFRGRESGRWTTNITAVREALKDAYAEQIRRSRAQTADARSGQQAEPVGVAPAAQEPEQELKASQFFTTPRQFAVQRAAAKAGGIPAAS